MVRMTKLFEITVDEQKYQIKDFIVDTTFVCHLPYYQQDLCDMAYESLH
jgi:hypothetical protein